MKFHCHGSPGAHPALGGAQAASRHQDQGHRDVGRRVGEHPGGVGHDHAALGAGGDVDVVVPHDHVGDDPQTRPGGIQQLRVDPVDHHGDQRVDAGHRREQLVSGHGGRDVAVGDLVPGGGQAGRPVAGEVGGDEDACHGHMIFRTRGSGRWRIAWPSGTHGQAGTRALAFSFSMASTMARTPVWVSTMNGVFLTRSFISERM